MDNKNNEHEESQDFTAKGRTNNPESAPGKEGENADISNIDQQEGTLNHGTTGKDKDLFSNGKEAKTSS